MSGWSVDRRKKEEQTRSRWVEIWLAILLALFMVWLTFQLVEKLEWERVIHSRERPPDIILLDVFPHFW